MKVPNRPSFEARKSAHLPSERKCAHPGMTVSNRNPPQLVIWAVTSAWLNIAFSAAVMSAGVFAV